MLVTLYFMSSPAAISTVRAAPAAAGFVAAGFAASGFVAAGFGFSCGAVAADPDMSANDNRIVKYIF
jgi:hypothetical protein